MNHTQLKRRGRKKKLKKQLKRRPQHKRKKKKRLKKRLQRKRKKKMKLKKRLQHKRKKKKKKPKRQPTRRKKKKRKKTLRMAQPITKMKERAWITQWMTIQATTVETTLVMISTPSKVTSTMGPTALETTTNLVKRTSTVFLPPAPTSRCGLT